jgi:transposase-like protein
MSGVMDVVADLPGLVLLARACQDDDAFHRHFGTEDACRDWFYRARWPKGFVCPNCGGSRASWQAARKVWQCRACHKQTSLTSGTLLERTKKPLRKWFEAAYLIVQRGVNARTLQRELGLTYKTAWVWAHKLRGALKGRETPANAERNESLSYDASRTRRHSVRHPHSSWTAPCGCSKLLTRDWGWQNEMDEEEEVAGLERRRRLGDRIGPEVTPEDTPPPRDMLAIYELLATYSGSVTEKHLCAYLDELAFRWNRRRRAPSEGFMTVVDALATTLPRTERTIARRPAPTGNALSIWSVWPVRKLRPWAAGKRRMTE